LKSRAMARSPGIPAPITTPDTSTQVLA